MHAHIGKLDCTGSKYVAEVATAAFPELASMIPAQYERMIYRIRNCRVMFYSWHKLVTE